MHRAIQWNLESARQSRVFEREKGTEITGCVTAPDGKSFAMFQSDGKVTLFDFATGKPLRVLGRERNPDKATAWNPVTGKRLHTYGREMIGRLDNLTLDPGQTEVWATAYINDERGAEIVKFEIGNERPTFQSLMMSDRSPSIPTALGFDPQDKVLVVGCRDGQTIAWRISALGTPYRTPKMLLPISSVVFPPNSNTFVAGTEFRAALRMKPRGERYQIAGDLDRSSEIGLGGKNVSPTRWVPPTWFAAWGTRPKDNRLLGLEPAARQIVVWDPAAKAIAERVRLPIDKPPRIESDWTGKFSRDGKLLVLGMDGMVMLFDATDGDKLWEFVFPRAGIKPHLVEMTRDGRFVCGLGENIRESPVLSG